MLVVDFFIRVLDNRNLATDDDGGYWIRKWTVTGWRSIIYTFTLRPVHHIKIVFTNNMWKTRYPVLRAFCFLRLLIVFSAIHRPFHLISGSRNYVYIHFITTTVCVHCKHKNVIRTYIIYDAAHVQDTLHRKIGFIRVNHPNVLDRFCSSTITQLSRRSSSDFVNGKQIIKLITVWLRSIVYYNNCNNFESFKSIDHT